MKPKSELHASTAHWMLDVQFIPCVRLGQRTDALPMLTLLSQQKSPHTICEQGHAKNNKTTSLAVSLEA